MYKIAKPLFLICETPLHAGSGSDLGIVDLPIQRERHTSFPKIEASGLKGAMREAFESAFKNDPTKDNLLAIHRVFGYDKDGAFGSHKQQINSFFGNDTQFSGSLTLTDARLLLFPVKSLYGVFAWITCPRIIKKFISELELGQVPFDFEAGDIENKTTSTSTIVNHGKAYLEEFIFSPAKDSEEGDVDKLAKWLKANLFGASDDSYWASKIEHDIVVLSDQDFRDFINLATEVITRTKINNATGTVQDGALFTEEYLPAESIMYSLAMFTDEFKKEAEDSNHPKRMKAKKEGEHAGVMEFFQDGLKKNGNIIQVGANATLGKGIMRTKFVSTQKEKEGQNA